MLHTNHRFTDAQLLEIISSSITATAIYTGDDIVINAANDGMLGFWGRDKSVIGKTMAEALPELIDQPFIGILQNVWRTGETYEAKSVPADIVIDGRLQTFYFDFIYKALKNTDGSTYCIIHTSADVTAAVKAGQATQRSEERFERIVSEAPVAIGILSGSDFVIGPANRQILKVWGKDETAVGKPLLAAIPELKDQPFLAILTDVLTTGNPYYGSEAKAVLMEEGKLHDKFFNYVYHPLKNDQGITTSVMVVASEITEQIQSRQELALSEQRFRSLINHVPVAMGMLSGSNLIIQMANQPLLNIWHKRADEVIGKPLAEAFSNPYQQSYPEQLKKVWLTGTAYHNPEETLWIQGPSGPIKFILNLNYTPVLEGSGQVTSILLTGIDVTAQIEYRQTMNLAQEQFKLAIDSAQLGTWNFDAATRSFQPSGRFKELYGYYSYEEMPDEAAIGQITQEYRGKVIAAINAALDHNEDFKIEYPIVKVHDKTVSWMQANGKLYRDGNGEPEHLSGIIVDITDQKQQIAQQNDFIAMASHELKTPVTSIKGLAQVMELMLRKEGNFKMADMALKLQSQVGRLITLIGDLLDITKLQAGKLQFDDSWFDFNAVVTDTIDELQRTTHKHDIISNLNFHGQIFGDKERIRQVIINFISNAIKYSPEADTIIVNTTVNSGYVELYVKDFGIGIERRHLKRVFDQFYRVTGSSEKKFKGLGLGLYISATIIQRSGGKIWADSEVGRGSTFCFSLPVEQRA